MKRTILRRSLSGALLGLSISYLITVWVSLSIGDGTYYPVPPSLLALCGSEMGAILLQGLFSLVLGAVFGGASVIWEVEGWSLFCMTLTHLMICSLSTFPIAYGMYWMPHTWKGIFSYCLSFFLLYCFIWLVLYLNIKHKIRQINRKLQQLDP